MAGLCSLSKKSLPKSTNSENATPDLQCTVVIGGAKNFLEISMKVQTKSDKEAEKENNDNPLTIQKCTVDTRDASAQWSQGVQN